MKKIIASPGAIDQLNDDLFIVQNKDYAEQAIASGEFVKWKGVGYVANTAIAIGDSFGANLTELSKGALNSLLSKITGKLDKTKLVFNANAKKIECWTNNDSCIMDIYGTTKYFRIAISATGELIGSVHDIG